MFDNKKENLSSKIRKEISELKYSDKVLGILCNRPLIPLINYEKLIEGSSLNLDTIIASKYNKLSVPTISPQKYFNKLAEIKGDALTDYNDIIRAGYNE